MQTLNEIVNNLIMAVFLAFMMLIVACGLVGETDPTAFFR